MKLNERVKKATAYLKKAKNKKGGLAERRLNDAWIGVGVRSSALAVLTLLDVGEVEFATGVGNWIASQQRKDGAITDASPADTFASVAINTALAVHALTKFKENARYNETVNKATQYWNTSVLRNGDLWTSKGAMNTSPEAFLASAYMGTPSDLWKSRFERDAWPFAEPVESIIQMAYATKAAEYLGWDVQPVLDKVASLPKPLAYRYERWTPWGDPSILGNLLWANLLRDKKLFDDMVKHQNATGGFYETPGTPMWGEPICAMLALIEGASTYDSWIDLPTEPEPKRKKAVTTTTALTKSKK